MMLVTHPEEGVPKIRWKSTMIIFKHKGSHKVLITFIQPNCLIISANLIIIVFFDGPYQSVLKILKDISM